MEWERCGRQWGGGSVFAALSGHAKTYEVLKTSQVWVRKFFLTSVLIDVSDFRAYYLISTEKFLNNFEGFFGER